MLLGLATASHKVLCYTSGHCQHCTHASERYRLNTMSCHTTCHSYEIHVQGTDLNICRSTTYHLNAHSTSSYSMGTSSHPYRTLDEVMQDIYTYLPTHTSVASAPIIKVKIHSGGRGYFHTHISGNYLNSRIRELIITSESTHHYGYLTQTSSKGTSASHTMKLNS